MEALSNFITRAEARKRTGWSFVFIDRHLPRVKVGRKVLIPLGALDRLLEGGSSNGR